jgi:hypothetical protein
MKIDYRDSADVYLPKSRGYGARQQLSYRRFASAAEAIRFVIEDFPSAQTLAPWMRVGDASFDSDAIRQLYDSSDYPLRRRNKKLANRSQRAAPTTRD